MVSRRCSGSFHGQQIHGQESAAVRQEVQLSGGIPPLPESSAPCGNTGGACGRVLGPRSSRLIGRRWTVCYRLGDSRLLVWWRQRGRDRSCCRRVLRVYRKQEVYGDRTFSLALSYILLFPSPFNTPGIIPFSEFLFNRLLLRTFSYFCVLSANTWPRSYFFYLFSWPAPSGFWCYWKVWSVPVSSASRRLRLIYNFRQRVRL